MNTKYQSHLSEEEIARAVVDDGDLSPALSGHLSECDPCRSAVVRFEREMYRLGETAATMTPSSGRSFYLSAETARPSVRRHLIRPFSLGTAVAGILAAFLFWGGHRVFFNTPFTGIHTGETQTASIWKANKEEALFVDVNMLAENALPLVYLEFSKEVETEPVSTETGGAAPIFDEDSLSLLLFPESKGGGKC